MEQNLCRYHADGVAQPRVMVRHEVLNGQALANALEPRHQCANDIRIDPPDTYIDEGFQSVRRHDIGIELYRMHVKLPYLSLIQSFFATLDLASRPGLNAWGSAIRPALTS